MRTPFLIIYLITTSAKFLNPQLVRNTSNRGIVLTSLPSDTALRSSINSTIREQFTKASDYSPPEFELVTFSTIVQSGRIYYLAKVKVGDFEYAHLKINKPLPNQAIDAFTLFAYQRGKSAGDPLVNFDHSNDLPVVQTVKKANTVTLTTTEPWKVGDGLVAKEFDGISFLNTTIRDEFMQHSQYNPPQFTLTATACQMTVQPFVCILKVQINDSEYVHLRLAKVLSHWRLTGFKRGRLLSDTLTYYESNINSTSISPTQEAFDEWASAEMNVTIHKQFVQKSGYRPSRFDLINYFTNEGANGTTYFLKVRITDQEYAHLCIWKPIGKYQQSATLIAYLRGKRVNDTLEYFTASDSQAQLFLDNNDKLGWSDLLQPDSECKMLLESVRIDFLNEAHMPEDTTLNVIRYRKFTAPGYHAYLLEVKPNADSYGAHVVVYKSWTSIDPAKASPKLIAFDLNQTLDDDLSEIADLSQLQPKVASSNAQQQPALSATQIADDETQLLVDSVLAEYIRKSTNHVAAMFAAFSERVQISNPSIHFVKVQLGTNSFIHLKIVKLDGDSRMLSFQINKTLFETIEYF